MCYNVGEVMRMYNRFPQQDPNKKDLEKMTTREFIRDCINRVFIGLGVLLVLYFLLSAMYDSWYISRIVNSLQDALRAMY